MAEARQRASLISYMGAANGLDVDTDELLRSWKFFLPEEPLDPNCQQKTQLALSGRSDECFAE